ncbi:MAG: hypothetical protein NTW21_13655 [Verrucomicrobia bacterium]|nr:hypothetical protein [Verrucomicrobiota bacterium]
MSASIRTESGLALPRADYLKDRPGYQRAASGGDRHEAWPPAVVAFLKGFLPVQNPPNYQLVADEMERLCNFKRARASVESCVKANLSHLFLIIAVHLLGEPVLSSLPVRGL